MESITEKTFAEQAGIPRAIIKLYREGHLSCGVDWRLVKRKVIILPAGRELLHRQFGDSEKIEKKAAKKEGAPADVLKTLSTPINRRIVLAVALSAEDAERKFKGPMRHHPITESDQRSAVLRVRVRDNSKFVRGMEIPVRHVQGDVYELSGNQPRQRGRF